MKEKITILLERAKHDEEDAHDLAEDPKRYRNIHFSSNKQLHRLLSELESDWMNDEVECSVDSIFCNKIVLGLS